VVAAVVGVPVMAPVVALIDSPVGSPDPVHESMVPECAGVCENATPTLPLRICPGEIAITSKRHCQNQHASVAIHLNRPPEKPNTYVAPSVGGAGEKVTVFCL